MDMFESSVNSECIENQGHHYCIGPGFESSVNSEGIESLKKRNFRQPRNKGHSK